MTRSKAYLFGGVEIRWSFARSCRGVEDVAEKATFNFVEGLKDYLSRRWRAPRWCIHIFTVARKTGADGAVAMGHGLDRRCRRLSEPLLQHHATPDGENRQSGPRTALTRGLKDHAERVGQGKRAGAITSDDVMVGAGAMLWCSSASRNSRARPRSVATAEAQRIVEQAMKHPFDHWLAGNPLSANKLLDFVTERDEEPSAAARKRHRAQKRGRELRLPGKLADCTASAAEDSKIFVVEGDRPAARRNRRATAPRKRSCRCAARS